MLTIWVPKRLVEVGLYNVAARSPAELAALSEQSYRERVRYAAEKVRFSGTKIVMLTGTTALRPVCSQALRRICSKRLQSAYAPRAPVSER